MRRPTLRCMVVRLKFKAQLFRDQAIAIGPGKADLLDAIARTGSISAAARDLGMSYRRGWLLVDTMNASWSEPLVETVVGGRAGATLSVLGQQVLTDYRALEAELAHLEQSGAARRLVRALESAEID